MTDERREYGGSWKSHGWGSPSVLDSSPPTVDELFALLSSHRRRYLLAALDRDPTPVRIADVAAEITAIESDVPSTLVDDDRRRDVRSDLFHNHLPKLRDAGLVTYDRDAGTVEPGEHVTEAEPLLDIARQITERECSNDD